MTSAKPPRYTPQMENEFEKIIQEAISKAEQVDCDIEEFKQGLKDMWHALQTRIECES